MATFKIPTFPLTHGGSIPVIGYGLGTARYKSNVNDPVDQQTVDYTKLALKTGFNHLDGAETYGNEAELGLGLEQSSVDRSSVFLTTKVLESMSNVSKALDVSLKRLRTDYVDLFLVHSPFFNEKEVGLTIEEVWLEMEKLQKSGKAKAIGVSNFDVGHLERVLKVATIIPACNEIEFNPYLQQPELIELHKKHNIVTEAYHPLGPITAGKGGPLEDVIEKLVKKYGKTDSQILLRWTIDVGVVVLTTSSKESRLKEALDVVNFKLDQEDIDEISKVGSKHHHRTFWRPEFGEK